MPSLLHQAFDVVLNYLNQAASRINAAALAARLCSGNDTEAGFGQGALEEALMLSALILIQCCIILRSIHAGLRLRDQLGRLR